jgi:rubrerythrin
MRRGPATGPVPAALRPGKAEDLDIICPCDYRDADLGEFDACYCALYVSRRVYQGEIAARSIPERRPPEDERKRLKEDNKAKALQNTLPLPVWRCRVCGYLSARARSRRSCAPSARRRRNRLSGSYRRNGVSGRSGGDQ